MQSTICVVVVVVFCWKWSGTIILFKPMTVSGSNIFMFKSRMIYSVKWFCKADLLEQESLESTMICFQKLLQSCHLYLNLIQILFTTDIIIIIMQCLALNNNNHHARYIDLILTSMICEKIWQSVRVKFRSEWNRPPKYAFSS